MDLFMFSFFGMGAAVGFYALAQKIVITIVTTITSITQVVSPNFTGIKTRKQTRLVIKSALAYLSIPVVLYLMLLILPDQLFHFIFTKEYAQSLGITKSLVFPYILFILGQIPFLYILYVARKTSYILYSNIIFFLGMTFGSYFLIPILGVFAPAYIISFSIFFSILIQAIAAYYAYKKLPA
jgi:O-antigen/teichoic acid export membrane protein